MLVLALICLAASCGAYTRDEVAAAHPGFGRNWIMIEGSNGSYTFGYLRQSSKLMMDFTYADPKSVVNFTLFTRDSPEGGVMTQEAFDLTKPTKFITHGWLSDGRSDTCVSLKDRFLERYDCNVFVMDWSGISRNILYPVAMKATKPVGAVYADFINQIIDLGASPDDIHLVGHSLGAHVSGFAARGAKSKLGRVSGLDPALPGFNRLALVDGTRLSREDAQFVDVIHTCSGYLGLSEPIGHADFYPNGGSVPQPGCEVSQELMEGCSHGMSWRLFAASLKEDNLFHSVECASLEDYTTGVCAKEPILMGDPAPATARGNFYLQTGSRDPYAIEFHKAEK